MGFGVPMAVDTPSHRLILGLVNNFHLINPTVACNTRNATVHVSGVVEINKVRQSVNSNPIDRLARSPTVVNRL